ncbi:MAG: DNA polymerase III subunit [Planctomycetes bacterium]|nr:DNA polymerase III subunit [Planctomycetota bacterium]
MQEILGQPKAIESLTSAITSGRVHHAWIFSGPKGVGKFTTAKWFAKKLLSAEDSQIENHPDLHIIQKELALFSQDKDLRTKKLTNIPLDLLRERMIGGQVGSKHYQAAAYLTPVLGNGKIFIIDEAELLDETAQNSILKTLEEPPAQTYIILVTSQPQRLLPTIRSRCQHARFGTLNEQEMSQWLDQANLSTNQSQRKWIEHFSDGSPGIAQLASENEFYNWQITLNPMLGELDDGRYPSQMGQTLAELVETFAKSWVDKHDNASKDAANKDGVRHLLNLLAAHSRKRLGECADRSDDCEYWLNVIDLLRNAEQQLYSNVNIKLLLENLVAQWASQTVTTC